MSSFLSGVYMIFSTKLTEIAKNEAKKSNCVKDQVGAVIFDNAYNVIATGYNHNPSGVCELRGKTKPDTIHAEHHALSKLTSINRTKAKNMLVTRMPCVKCARRIIDTNQLDGTCIANVYFLRADDDVSGWALLQEHGIACEQIE